MTVFAVFYLLRKYDEELYLLDSVYATREAAEQQVSIRAKPKNYAIEQWEVHGS